VIVCKNCGRENEDEYKFCLGCGSALPKQSEPPEESSGPEMMDCPHCGTQVPTNFKFCGACGGPISAEAAPAKSQPAQQAQKQEDPSSRGRPGTVNGQQGAPAASGAGTPAQTAAPTEASVGHLTVIRPDGSEGAEIALNAGENLVGRDSSEAVLSNDPFLSPRHATFIVDGNNCKVRDEDSLNGVFIRIRDEIELSHGDMIRLGQELLRFELISELEPVRDQKTDEDTRLSGSPDTGYWGRLSLIAGPGIVSRAFAIGEDAVQIGRETGDIVFRDDGFVSGKHARVTRVDGSAMLKDLGSSNGTYLRIRRERNLQSGDLILMGQQLFRLFIG
jgi:pSer/pThr/pTyr-binding forkhead associated (FHA) protein